MGVGEKTIISIDVVYKGPELRGSKINQLLTNTHEALIEMRGTFGTAPSVHAVFVVPGSLGDPDFDYLTYSEHPTKDNVVTVQIPIPREVAKGAGQLKFIIDALYAASAIAFELFRQRNQEFPLRQAGALATKVAQRVALTPYENHS